MVSCLGMVSLPFGTLLDLDGSTFLYMADKQQHSPQPPEESP